MAARQSHPLPTPPAQPQYQHSYQQGYPTQQYGQEQTYQQYSHPLPPQPQRQQSMPLSQTSSNPQKPRPKSRAFSFRSDKSGNSSGSHPNKIDLTETTAEKAAKRLHSKADPTLAINEAEPATVQATVKSSLASLRNIQHRDAYGNPISDPDKSNPTRSRWERPLDTIRSFEAAIDGGYNRMSMIRSDADSIANWNRRSSYYGNNAARFPQESYYGNRATPGRPESTQYDARPGGIPTRNSYFDQQGYNNNNNGYPANPPNQGRNRYPRMASEPQFQAYGRPDQTVYPASSNQRSYETVASASGSGISAEPAGYQTDPTSSDNSSIDRLQSPPKRQPEPPNDYGIAFTPAAAYQPQAFSVAPGNIPAVNSPLPPNPYQNGGSHGYAPPPPVPQKDLSSIVRKPTRTPSNDQLQASRPGMGEKRKSWFTRRFSKQG